MILHGPFWFSDYFAVMDQTMAATHHASHPIKWPGSVNHGMVFSPMHFGTRKLTNPAIENSLSCLVFLQVSLRFNQYHPVTVTRMITCLIENPPIHLYGCHWNPGCPRFVIQKKIAFQEKPWWIGDLCCDWCYLACYWFQHLGLKTGRFWVGSWVKRETHNVEGLKSTSIWDWCGHEQPGCSWCNNHMRCFFLHIFM